MDALSGSDKDVLAKVGSAPCPVGMPSDGRLRGRDLRIQGDGEAEESREFGGLAGQRLAPGLTGDDTGGDGGRVCSSV